jgi:sterol desaturase/sphingolipid hydroxylase (fatty acid hydroxylase superfamily)
MQDFFTDTASAIHNALIIPLLYHLGWMRWEEIAYGWVLFALYGAAQVVLMLCLCWPAEKFFKLEHWPNTKSVGVDVLYTLLARIGIMPVFTFVLFYQAQMMLSGFLADHDVITPTLENFLPFLYGRPVLTFCLYLLILDCADYWRHRLSHKFNWWYGLHAVHHAQRQMTFWSDDRNHLLDDIIAFLWFMLIGLAINIPPMQFPLLILSLRLLESFSHANARISFGRVGEYLLVSPRFHRLHHGFEGAGRHSCNYGALLPCWDVIFGTVNLAKDYVATGDPTAEERLATGSWWQQQLGGIARMLGQPGTRQANIL